MLRKTFRIAERPESATLEVTGLGYYFCYLNGERVGDVEAAPSYTWYKKRVEYNRFEVGGLLRRGENVLAIHLGAHWPSREKAEGLLFKPYYTGENMACCALFWGEEAVLSDTVFQVHASPVVDSGIYDGETYDARLEPVGWQLPGFDAGEWEYAREKENPAALVCSAVPPVRIVENLPPLSSWRSENGIVYDFGVNISGKLTVEGNFSAGSRIRMRHAECLSAKGRELNTGSLRTARATDEYIARGGGEKYTPLFTYHGFRYAEVACDRPEELAGLTVAANVVHTDLPDICTFETDSALLNDVFHMMRRTFLNNLYSVPTDCHQRDERQGWLGDAQLSCESVLHCFDAAQFYRKYLDDIADTVSEDGSLTYLTAPPLYEGQGLMWSGAYYMIVDALYRYFEDVDTVRKHYGRLRNYFSWLEQRQRDGFPQIGGLGDWLSIAHTDERQIRDAVYIDYAAKLSTFAGALKLEEDAAYYRQKCGYLKKRYNELYYSPHESTGRNSGYYGACDKISQLGNALPLCYGIVEDGNRARVAEKLVYDLKCARGGLFPTTGLIGTKYLFDALEVIGRDDVALALLMKKSYPSLGFMRSKGATTVWERWEYMTDNEMNSHCHTPLAAPCKWMITRLAGITFPRTENGVPVFEVRPFLSPKLKYVQASLKTPRGRIFLRWERDGQGYRIRVEAPEDSRVCFQNQEFPGGKLEFTSV